MKRIASIASIDSAGDSRASSGKSSDIEKQKRRELMANAAKEREKHWDKRVAAASQKRGGRCE